MRHVLFCLIFMLSSQQSLAEYPEETFHILGWLGYEEDVDFRYRSDVRELEWLHATDPKPTDVYLTAQRKPYWGAVRIEDIYAEQELRSVNIPMQGGGTLGFPLPRSVIQILEETYLNIIESSARRPITEADTPFWHGAKTLRDNRETLLSGLAAWISDPARTAEDIRDFDVAGWAGWAIARPAFP